MTGAVISKLMNLIAKGGQMIQLLYVAVLLGRTERCSFDHTFADQHRSLTQLGTGIASHVLHTWPQVSENAKTDR